MASSILSSPSTNYRCTDRAETDHRHLYISTMAMALLQTSDTMQGYTRRTRTPEPGSALLLETTMGMASWISLLSNLHIRRARNRMIQHETFSIKAMATALLNTSATSSASNLDAITENARFGSITT